MDALRTAGGDGRLSAEELDARLESAFSARTLGELARLTTDLPTSPGAKDVLLIKQRGGKYVREGRWQVPARMHIETHLCRITLDFTEAVITSPVVRIDIDMRHGRLLIITSPGMEIDADGIDLTFSKVKLHSDEAAAYSRLRIEFAGALAHARLIERRRRD